MNRPRGTKCQCHVTESVGPFIRKTTKTRYFSVIQIEFELVCLLVLVSCRIVLFHRFMPCGIMHWGRGGTNVKRAP